MAVFFWWLALQIIGVLAMPLTAWLFRGLPHAGLAWSKALGLLVVAWVAWFVAMLNLATFGIAAVLIGCLALAGASWFVSRRRTLAAVRQAIGRHWPAWLLYELLFAAMLGAGLYLRMHGLWSASAISGTEKPMELMFLNAILTSPSFPPHDLWLSGYSLNYYYLGYVLIAVVKVLSGAGLGEAFNLGVATVYGLTAIGAAGLVASLIQRRFPPAEPAEAAPRRAAIRPGTILAAMLAAGFVLVAGNQIGALQRIVGSADVNRLGDAARVQVLKEAILRIEPRTVDPDLLKAEVPNWEVSTTLQPMNMEDFDAWQPSRAIYDDVGKGTVTIDGATQREGVQQDQVITEFPFFSFYLGDLHPHVLALPFVILVMGLGLATLMRASAPRLAAAEDYLELALAGLIVGSPYMINSWDAPTYGAIYAAALALMMRHHLGLPPRQFWLAYAKRLGLVLAAALILFLPFLLTFDSFAGQDQVPEPFSRWPIIRTLGRIIGPAQDHSGWTDLVAIFGLFLVPLTAWWTRHLRGWAAWLAIALTLAGGLAIGIPALVFAPLGFFALRAAWQQREPRVSSFILVASGIATLLIFATDIFYLRDNFDRRFNTVFKVYYQVWLILGIASAYAVWSLLHSGRWRRLATVAWAPLFLLLGAGALVYPVSVLSPSTTPSWDVPRDLDGLAHSGQFNDGAKKAADWLRANAPIDAVLAGSPGNSYNDGGEVATLSGRPTLLGWWGSHESLWRTKQPDAKENIQTRLRDIETIYTSADPAAVRDILKKYNVAYVVWGPNEQRAYPASNGAAIQTIGPRVHDADGWTIFQVTQ